MKTEKIGKIRDRAWPELSKKRNVVMAVPGTKIKGDVNTGKKALVVGVTQKLPLWELSAEDVVPPKIEGVVTDVREVGEIYFLQEEEPNRKKKWRPAPGGVSIGHYLVTAGTLGMAVKKNGKKYILSNNHVLANTNQAEIGDPILQPGAYDGGRETDKIAELTEFKYINIEKIPGPELTLLYPNGGEKWIIGQTVTISWHTESPGNIRIDLSRDGGISWVAICSSTPGEEGKWSWKVSPIETEKGRVRVVDITNPPYNSDMSDGTFSIKKPESPEQPEPSKCKTSKAVATGLNLLWTATGRKTRFVAVVPATQSSEPELNLIDAALAKPINDEDVLDEILEIGMPNGFVEPEVGMKVKKSGRTTGLNQGEITYIGATIKIDFGENRTATFADQIIMTPIAEGGDSGSIVFVDSEENQVVGLLFAGSSKIAVANKYSNVKKELNLD